MEKDVNLDYVDYQTILLQYGKIDGRVGSCKVTNLITSLGKDFQTSLGNAKGILLEFEQNKDSELIQITSLMEEFSMYFNENADVVFGVKQNDTLNIGDIKYKIIASGLKI